MKLIIRKGGNMTEKEIKLYKAQGKVEMLQQLICTLNNSQSDMMRPKDLAGTLLGVLDFITTDIKKMEFEAKEQEG